MSEEYVVPDGLYYSGEHEWVKVQEDGTVVIGVSDYAQKTLHDIVYVELPDVWGLSVRWRALRRSLI